jgi:hypothetical protein
MTAKETYKGASVEEAVETAEVVSDIDLPAFLTDDLPANGASMLAAR